MGMHPRVMSQVAGHFRFTRVLRKVRADLHYMLQERPAVPIIIAPFCKKGRHRSVAFALLLEACLYGSSTLQVEAVLHSERATWFMGTCDECRECRAFSEHREEAKRFARQMWLEPAN